MKTSIDRILLNGTDSSSTDANSLVLYDDTTVIFGLLLDGTDSSSSDIGDDIDVMSKVSPSMSVSKTDLGRRNPGSTSYDNIGYSFGMVAGLTEKANHTTTAVQGISPNMTYRTSKGGKATKSSFSSLVPLVSNVILEGKLLSSNIKLISSVVHS